jgi:hypothetical protein
MWEFSKQHGKLPDAEMPRGLEPGDFTLIRHALLRDLFLCSWIVFGQTSPPSKWISNLTFFDQPDYDHMELELGGTRLTANSAMIPLKGRFRTTGSKAPQNRIHAQPSGCKALFEATTYKARALSPRRRSI